MPIIVTQNYSESVLSKKSFDWRSTLVWTVSGTDDPDVAIESCIAAGTPLADNPAMLCQRRWAQNFKGPTTFKVYAEFGFGDPGLCATTPLNENPKILWEPDREMIPVDIDQNGNPILNSAGDVIQPSPQRPLPTVALIVRKYLPYYNVSVALQFQDSVNQAPFTLAGAGGVDTGQCYCDYIRPIEPYTLAAPYVFVEWRLRFKSGKQPWQYKPIDQGFNGWYDANSAPADGTGSSSGTGSKPQWGPFCDLGGNPVTTPVLLNGSGLPLQPTAGTAFYVRGTNGSPYNAIANPSTPAGLGTDPALSGSTITTLIWQNLKQADFTSLGF